MSAFLYAWATGSAAASATDAPGERSPVNQVFQFAASTETVLAPDKPPRKSTAYLWIPEECRRLRGLIIMATNVPEQMLAGNATLRKACSDNGFGIVWAAPSFWNFGKNQNELEPVSVATLEKLLAGLAEKSGYEEITTIPWIPIGESGHLLMVCGLINQRPEKVIAGICVKNPQRPKNYSVPMLWTYGSAQEWGQKSGDVREEWRKHLSDYVGWAKDREKNEWPLSMLIEPATGHFACTEAMVDYLCDYIRAAIQVRLGPGGEIRPVDLNSGYLANLPVPGVTALSITRYSDAAAGDRARAWFFTEELARKAQRFAQANWNAGSQMVGLEAKEGCTATPYSFNSVTELFVKTDGEFQVTAKPEPVIPEGFVNAGEKLETPPGAATVEWICGPVAPLGNGRFRIALDRTWKAGVACYLIVRQEGSANVRPSFQPVMVKLQENMEGTPQRITFDSVEDLHPDSPPVALSAHSDSGLPVQFAVISGPAVIRDGRLELTAIPPRSKFPVEVTVAAWQWGRPEEPKVQTAPIAWQTVRVAPR